MENTTTDTSPNSRTTNTTTVDMGNGVKATAPTFGYGTPGGIGAIVLGLGAALMATMSGAGIMDIMAWLLIGGVVGGFGAAYADKYWFSDDGKGNDTQNTKVRNRERVQQRGVTQQRSATEQAQDIGVDLQPGQELRISLYINNGENPNEKTGANVKAYVVNEKGQIIGDRTIEFLRAAGGEEWVAARYIEMVEKGFKETEYRVKSEKDGTVTQSYIFTDIDGNVRAVELKGDNLSIADLLRNEERVRTGESFYRDGNTTRHTPAQPRGTASPSPSPTRQPTAMNRGTCGSGPARSDVEKLYGDCRITAGPKKVKEYVQNSNGADVPTHQHHQEGPPPQPRGHARVTETETDYSTHRHNTRVDNSGRVSGQGHIGMGKQTTRRVHNPDGSSTSTTRTSDIGVSGGVRTGRDGPEFTGGNITFSSGTRKATTERGKGGEYKHDYERENCRTRIRVEKDGIRGITFGCSGGGSTTTRTREYTIPIIGR